MTFWHTFFEVLFWTSALLTLALAGLWVWIRCTDTGNAKTLPEILRILGDQLTTGLYRFNRWLHEETVLTSGVEPEVRFLAAPPEWSAGNVWDVLSSCDHYPMGMVPHAKEQAVVS